MGGNGVGKAGELSAGEVVTIHRNESGNEGRSLCRGVDVVKGVEAVGDEGCESGFAWEK